MQDRILSLFLSFSLSLFLALSNALMLLFITCPIRRVVSAYLLTHQFVLSLSRLLLKFCLRSLLRITTFCKARILSLSLSLCPHLLLALSKTLLYFNFFVTVPVSVYLLTHQFVLSLSLSVLHHFVSLFLAVHARQCLPNSLSYSDIHKLF